MPPAKRQRKAPGQGATFLSLPAELRNYIYELSGCLKIVQCRKCHATISEDKKENSRICCNQPRPRLPRPQPNHCEYRSVAFLWVNRKYYVKDKTDQPRYGRHFLRPHNHTMDTHVREHTVPAAPPALTQVSRQVRAETLPMFYGGDHVFFVSAVRRADGLDEVREWLEAMGGDNVALAREVRVALPKGVEPERVKRVEGTLRELSGGLGEGGKWKVVESVEAAGGCRCETCVLPKEEKGE